MVAFFVLASELPPRKAFIFGQHSYVVNRLAFALVLPVVRPHRTLQTFGEGVVVDVVLIVQVGIWVAGTPFFWVLRDVGNVTIFYLGLLLFEFLISFGKQRL